MKRIWAAPAAFLILTTSSLGLDPAHAASKKKLDALEVCDSDQAFDLDFDNTFFPLPTGQQWILRGEEDGEPLGLQITVLDETEALFGGAVTTRVVEECEWSDTDGDGVVDPDEELIEVSVNFFAEPRGGSTVCYFGEEVTEFENGDPVPGSGAWRADDPGNAPGIFMPEDPRPGMTFAQEVAPGVAEDEVKVVGSGPANVPAGSFENDETIRFREFNPLDFDKGYKVFGEDVGLLRDAALELTEFGDLDRPPCAELL